MANEKDHSYEREFAEQRDDYPLPATGETPEKMSMGKYLVSRILTLKPPMVRRGIYTIPLQTCESSDSCGSGQSGQPAISSWIAVAHELVAFHVRLPRLDMGLLRLLHRQLDRVRPRRGV